MKQLNFQEISMVSGARRNQQPTRFQQRMGRAYDHTIKTVAAGTVGAVVVGALAAGGPIGGAVGAFYGFVGGAALYHKHEDIISYGQEKYNDAVSFVGSYVS